MPIDFHLVIGSACVHIREYAVRDLCLFHFHRHPLRQLVYQQSPLVPQLIGIGSLQLYDIDLLVQ